MQLCIIIIRLFDYRVIQQRVKHQYNIFHNKTLRMRTRKNYVKNYVRTQPIVFNHRENHLIIMS